MPSFPDGVHRAIIEGCSGVATYAIVSALFLASGIPHAIVIFNIFSIISVIFLLDKMTYWSLTYMLGWAFGLLVIGTHVFGLIELLLYGGITGIVLYIKINNRL